MRIKFKLPDYGLLFCTALLTLALLHLNGARSPISQMEIEHYLSTIEAQTQIPGGRHDLAQLRRFLEADDGLPFFTVNLYQFHEQARYLETTSNVSMDGVSGEQAYSRFSAEMIRLLPKYSAYPIFGTEEIFHNSQKASADWHKLVIVKYRSRRDIAELFASDKYAEISAHKWAAIKAHQRFLVSARFIPRLDILVGVIWLITLFLLIRRLGKNNKV